MLTMDQKQQILHHYRVDRSSFMYKDSVLLGPFFVLTTMDRLGEVRIKEPVAAISLSIKHLNSRGWEFLEAAEKGGQIITL